MNIEFIIIVLACAALANLSFFFGRKAGESIGFARARGYMLHDYEIVEALAITLVHCTIGVTIRSRVVGDNSFERLADILKPLKSHEKCMLEILQELTEFEKTLRSAK